MVQIRYVIRARRENCPPPPHRSCPWFVVLCIPPPLCHLQYMQTFVTPGSSFIVHATSSPRSLAEHHTGERCWAGHRTGLAAACLRKGMQLPADREGVGKTWRQCSKARRAGRGPSRAPAAAQHASTFLDRVRRSNVGRALCSPRLSLGGARPPARAPGRNATPYQVLTACRIKVRCLAAAAEIRLFSQFAFISIRVKTDGDLCLLI